MLVACLSLVVLLSSRLLACTQAGLPELDYSIQLAIIKQEPIELLVKLK